MEPVLTDIDEVLTTTRSVRLRLDMDRPVPDDVLLECIDIAEQGPGGGNQSSRRWMVIRSPEKKQAIAELYHDLVGQFMIGSARKLAGTGHPNERVMRSAAHLAENMADVPAIVIPTIWGVHDNSGKPGLFDSVVQSAWSFCLALRARGLGSAWTTAHLTREQDAAEILGIPPGVTQIVLLPVAYTKGLDFKPVPRRGANQITYFETWGNTLTEPDGDEITLAEGPGVIGEVDIEAAPSAIWPIITDITVPAQFSTELQSAEWDDGFDGPSVGATFTGTNRHEAIGEWQTTCHVVGVEENLLFAWNVSDPSQPGAQWRFEIDALHGRRARLRQCVTLGPGPSGISAAIESKPEREAQIIARRQDEHRANIERNLRGIKDLAESAGT